MKRQHASTRSAPQRSIVAFVVLGAGFAAAHEADAQPLGSPRLMTSAGLVSLYSGKTWLWEGGGGYFAPDGRFMAYVAKAGSEPTYAKGWWWINGQGGMCFKATWHQRAGVREASKCFGHRVDGDVIFQREEPQGFWYVFRNEAVPHPQDEFGKLRPGNRIEGQVNRLQRALVRRPASTPQAEFARTAPRQR